VTLCRGQGSTYSVAGLSAKSSASRIKPRQFAPAQYQQVRRQAAMPIDPIANRDRVRLKHAFSRSRFSTQAIMSVYRTRGVETQYRSAGDASSIVRHHAQHQRHGPSITTRSPVLRTPSNRSRNGPTCPPGLLRMRTSSATAGALHMKTKMIVAVRAVRIPHSFRPVTGDQLNQAKFDQSSWSGTAWEPTDASDGTRSSVPPEVFKARRAQLCVPHGMRDRDVPKPILDCPGIVTVIGKFVAAAMPQHVRMHRQ
jgi:hypothetical protein